jgi:hypothetical protein
MKIDFTPDRSLYPFEPRCFDSYAGRMHYVDEGARMPILFCHGNPSPPHAGCRIVRHGPFFRRRRQLRASVPRL